MEDLIQKAKEGAPSAWKELMKIYLPNIKSIAKSYTVPGLDLEDLIQEGMLGFFKAVNSFDVSKNENFESFLEMCVRRQVISALRHATRQKDIPPAKFVYLEEEWVNPDSSMENRDLSDLLHSFDIPLSDLERKVLKKYMEGKSYKEIAGELGYSLKTVDNALQRIKRKLRKMIEPPSPLFPL